MTEGSNPEMKTFSEFDSVVAGISCIIYLSMNGRGKVASSDMPAWFANQLTLFLFEIINKIPSEIRLIPPNYKRKTGAKNNLIIYFFDFTFDISLFLSNFEIQN